MPPRRRRVAKPQQKVTSPAQVNRVGEKRPRKNEKFRNETAILHRTIVFFVLLVTLSFHTLVEKGLYKKLLESLGLSIEYSDSSSSPAPNEIEPSLTRSDVSVERRIEQFLTWFVGMGGSISPRVTLGSFPDFGGYGLMAVHSNDATMNQKDNKIGNFAVEQMDEMFTVPPSIITSADSIASRYQHMFPNFQEELRKAIVPYFPAHMVQQDVLIALALLVECTLGEASTFRPYLDVLPREVPRLDTFSDVELSMLQDPDLSSLAKQSLHRLKNSWERGGLKEFARTISNRAAKEAHIDMAAWNESASMCLSFESFHKYVAMVSSRAMVLQGTKFLTPLADMANFAPRNDGRATEQSQSFLLYHQRNANGSITVRADRNVAPGHQIFEDYGDVDNSLYLEAHGFVPKENPFHCTVIPGKHLPQPSSLSDELLDVLAELKILPRSVEADVAVPSPCVMEDASLPDEQASAYLSVAALANNTVQRTKCLTALQTGDVDHVTMQCVRYGGHRKAVEHTLRRAAQASLDNAETSIAQDLSSLEEILKRGSVVGGSHEKTVDPTRASLALKFRIADKKMLLQISTDNENQKDEDVKMSR